MKQIKGFKTLQFQQDSIEKSIEVLSKHGSVCNFSQTGLGKTYMAAMTALNMNAKRVRVITIAANRSEWRAILKKTGIAHVVSTANKLDSQTLTSLLDNENKFDFVIVDEAHKFQSGNSKMYENLSMLIHKNRCKVMLLSATPFQNNMENLATMASLLKIRMDSPLFFTLGEVLCLAKNLENSYKLDVTYNDNVNTMQSFTFGRLLTLTNLLGSLFSHLTVINTQQDVKKEYPNDMEMLGAFPKQINRDVSYETEHWRFSLKSLNYTLQAFLSKYVSHQLLKDGWTKIPQGDNLDSTGVMKTLFGKMYDSSETSLKCAMERMLERSYEMLKHKDKNEVPYKGGTYQVKAEFWDGLQQDIDSLELFLKRTDGVTLDTQKLSKLLEIYKTHPNEKIIVFTEYNDTLELLKEFAKQNLEFQKCAFVNGSTKKTEINKVKRNFDANINTKNDITYLFSTDVLATGVNLHSASVLVNFDMAWNPSKLLQRGGRINRLTHGKNHEQVYVYTFRENPYAAKYIALEEKLTHKGSLSNEFMKGLYTPFEFKYLPKGTVYEGLNVYHSNYNIEDTFEFKTAVKEHGMKKAIEMRARYGVAKKGDLSTMFPVFHITHSGVLNLDLSEIPRTDSGARINGIYSISSSNRMRIIDMLDSLQRVFDVFSVDTTPFKNIIKHGVSFTSNRAKLVPTSVYRYSSNTAKDDFLFILFKTLKKHEVHLSKNIQTYMLNPLYYDMFKRFVKKEIEITPEGIKAMQFLEIETVGQTAIATIDVNNDYLQYGDDAFTYLEVK